MTRGISAAFKRMAEHRPPTRDEAKEAAIDWRRYLSDARAYDAGTCDTPAPNPCHGPSGARGLLSTPSPAYPGHEPRPGLVWVPLECALAILRGFG